MTFTQDLKVVTRKYSMPPILPQASLPGEVLSTFPDILLYEITLNDDTLAAFKFTRFNNYKRGLYNSLGEYENPAAL
jgi:hypothetical protein